MGRRHGAPGCVAFTLIELLVVVAVIALLVGLLVPAMSSARKASQLVQSLSQMREITIAALDYADANDGVWPILGTRGGELVSSIETAPGVRIPNGSSASSWMYGGKSTHPYWWTTGRPRSITGAIQEKAGGLNWQPSGFDLYSEPGAVHTTPGLNTFIEPELITYHEDHHRFTDRADQRREVEIFRCPADRSTFQRRWSQLAVDPPDVVRDSTISTYDDVGTSYQLNLTWFTELRQEYLWSSTNRLTVPSGSSFSNEVWKLGVRAFRTSSPFVPSEFAWLKDEVADVVARYSWRMPGIHGGVNRAKLAYYDGSVRYVEIIEGETRATGYSFTFRKSLEPLRERDD
ncbi:MAG: hypothetical protein AAGI30_03315 [Planctomycetota bacterium]